LRLSAVTSYRARYGTFRWTQLGFFFSSR
jgi:hypothetical protein